MARSKNDENIVTRTRPEQRDQSDDPERHQKIDEALQDLDRSRAHSAEVHDEYDKEAAQLKAAYDKSLKALTDRYADKIRQADETEERHAKIVTELFLEAYPFEGQATKLELPSGTVKGVVNPPSTVIHDEEALHGWASPRGVVGQVSELNRTYKVSMVNDLLKRRPGFRDTIEGVEVHRKRRVEVTTNAIPGVLTRDLPPLQQKINDQSLLPLRTSKKDEKASKKPR